MTLLYFFACSDLHSQLFETGEGLTVVSRGCAVKQLDIPLWDASFDPTVWYTINKDVVLKYTHVHNTKES